MIVTENDDHRIKRLIRRTFKFTPKGVSDDEMYVAGLEGLWRAKERYCPSRGTWAQYSDILIQGAMIDYIRGYLPGSRRGRSRGHKALFPVSYDVENSDGQSLRETLPETKRVDAKIQESEAVDQLLEGLSLEERFIAKCIMIHGITQTVVAKAVGLQSSRVSQILQSLKIRIKINATRMLQLSS